jgi:ATP-binding cassette, subfamily B, bacterial MsbA
MRGLSTFRALWHLLNPSRFWFITTLVLGSLSSLSEGVGITLFIPILNSVQTGAGSPLLPRSVALFFPRTAENRLGPLVACVFVLLIIKNLLVYANRALLSWVNTRTGHELRQRVFDELMQASFSFWQKRDPGRILDTLSNETWRTAEAFKIFGVSLVQGSTIALFTIMLLVVSWKLTVLVICCLLLISLVIARASRPVKEIGERAVDVNAELGARMWDGVAGIRTIHAYSMQDQKRERFTQTSNNVRASFLKLELFSGLVQPSTEIVYAALLLALLVWQLPHATSVPTFLVFLLLLFRLQPNVTQLQVGWVTLTSLAGSIENVTALLDSAQKARTVSGDIRFDGLDHAISFEGVTFQYGEENRSALVDINLRIPAKKVTAIVGNSGAGKSTLIHLICRFYNATAGTIRADEHGFPALDLETWRDRVALASQDTHLFNTTVRENIALGKRGATDAEIIEAARRANAHEFIKQLPVGYDTSVGERGLQLSAGQRQRIAVARAFIRNPDILILDEATNAVDSVAEEAVLETLRQNRGNQTIIIVAHRLSTIAIADHVIVLKDGGVVEQGTPSELATIDGVFSELFRIPSLAAVVPTDI